jgi:hypothetical protein
MKGVAPFFFFRESTARFFRSGSWGRLRRVPEMRRQREREVSYEGFLRTALELRCDAPSALERPRVGECCRAYRSNVADFLAGETYGVRYVDEATGRLVDREHANSSPLPFRTLLEKPEYVRAILDDWRGRSGEWDRSLPYLGLHCAGCDRVVVIDGMHRLAWLGSREEMGQELFVVELSGFRWRREAPDIGIVCACR